MTDATPLSPQGFAEIAGVSRETLAQLEIYLALLATWQPALNLVSGASLHDPWRRHVLDSAQLAVHIRQGAAVADLGAGAGFPGMVLAILAAERGFGRVTLVEADQRKCGFLREVRRLTGAEAEILAARAESLAPLEADVIVARALAPLTTLLGYARPHRRPGGRCLFLKGERVRDELTGAAKSWTMDYALHPSLSDPRGVILEVGEFEHV